MVKIITEFRGHLKNIADEHSYILNDTSHVAHRTKQKLQQFNEVFWEKAKIKLREAIANAESAIDVEELQSQLQATIKQYKKEVQEKYLGASAEDEN